MSRGLRFLPVLAGALMILASPVFAGAPGRAPAPPQARAAVMIDIRDRRVLYALRPDEPVAPASLAKMVVALLAAERLHPDDTVKISRAAATARHDLIRWPEGATFTVDTVLHGMLMESSNGAAIAIAERVAGSVAAFMPLMNERARAAGATRSRFVNPHGLDAPGQRATARDLALVAAEMVAKPWLVSIVGTRSYSVGWPDGTQVTFHTINAFLLQYAGAIGLKTGFTAKAGFSLAAAASRDGVTLVAVVMNDTNRNRDAARLLDFGFRIAPPAVRPTAEAPPPEISPPVEAARSPARPAGLKIAGAALAVGGAWALHVRDRRMARRARRARGPSRPTDAEAKRTRAKVGRPDDGPPGEQSAAAR